VLDDSLVESARANLKLQSAAQLLYGMIKRDYMATDTAPLNLVDIYGSSGSNVFVQAGAGSDMQQISSLFTYEGYHDYFSKNLGEFIERAERDAWVLDDNPGLLSLPEKNQLRGDLRDLYFSDYSRTWERMLGSLEVVPFKNLAQASGVLNVASSSTSPIRRALEVTARNTSLVNAANAEMLGKAGELGAKVGAKVASRSRLGRLFNSVSDQSVSDLPAAAQINLPEQVIDDRFESLNEVTLPSAAGTAPLDPVLNILSQLYGQLDAISGGFGPDGGSLVKSEILMRLQTAAARQPEPLRGWLLGIALNIRSIMFGASRDQINREWQATVYPRCRAALNGRYPFVKGAQREVTLSDFGQLFAPGGTIDTFYIAQILPLTEVRGGRRQWKNVDGMGIGMPNAVLQLFQRAAAIKGMFFQGGGNRPSIAFKMKPVYLDANVDSVSVNLEGQDFTYRHGPQFQQPAQWPYPDSNGVVRLEFIDDSGNSLVRKFEGPWAWFRLLGESELKSKTGDIALVTFEHRGRRASWELHAQSVENPFLMSQLSRFHCPERL
jgi:type VI secretion system protein ImpL